MKDYSTEEKEKYILIAVSDGDTGKTNASLDELDRLLDTAGGEGVYRVIQTLPHPNSATYVGTGKAEELRSLVEAYEADAIISDDELSPAQLRNLSDLTECKVIDRTMLILDIFAAHAKTKEGKIQVEMAQLSYRSSHLTGMGKALSRLGGGIGTRGPGETKLETDRRTIQKRMSRLRKEISSIKQVRETNRKQRQNNQVPVVSIIGYTNAGKSTLLNRLTKADVLAEDKLFATLDPTTRRCVLPDGKRILFTDTVGFISKLPHQLIDAFRSTLEEAKYADILLHVVDASDIDMEEHMQVVYETLSVLGISGKPIITVFNKSDLIPPEEKFLDQRATKSIKISAKEKENMNALYEALEEFL